MSIKITAPDSDCVPFKIVSLPKNACAVDSYTNEPYFVLLSCNFFSQEIININYVHDAHCLIFLKMLLLNIP